MQRRANPLILISQNPLYFQAPEVERFANDIYLVRHGWITICGRLAVPTWQFYASHARIRLDRLWLSSTPTFASFAFP